MSKVQLFRAARAGWLRHNPCGIHRLHMLYIPRYAAALLCRMERERRKHALAERYLGNLLVLHKQYIRTVDVAEQFAQIIDRTH